LIVAGLVSFFFKINAPHHTSKMKVTLAITFALFVAYAELFLEFPYKDWLFLTMQKPHLAAPFGGPPSKSSAAWLLVHHLQAVVHLSLIISQICWKKIPKNTLTASHFLLCLIVVWNCTVFLDWHPRNAAFLNLGMLMLLTLLLENDAYSWYLFFLSLPILFNIPILILWSVVGNQYVQLFLFIAGTYAITRLNGKEIPEPTNSD
jgi:hypothetical protein